MGKYTVTGSPQIEQKIALDMQLLANRIDTILPASDFLAVILGGGYGRGEGGVRKRDNEELLFNDYDIFVISRDIPPYRIKKYRDILPKLSSELTALFGIDVDFSPIQPVRVLPKAPFWLIWYELKYGHQVIWGKPNILKYLPAWKGEDIPLEEAAKLLLNRGVGLFLAKQEIAKETEKSGNEFVIRNIYKAVLAMGDSLLMCHKCFHWSYRERLTRFEGLVAENLITNNRLLPLYREAVEYKLNPFDTEYDLAGYQLLYNEILAIYQEVYYFVFARMFQVPRIDLRSYIAHLEDKFYIQTDFGNALKNLALNLRDLKGQTFDFDSYFRYPRYRLFFCLPWILFNADYTLYQLDNMLGIPAGSPDCLRQKRFIELWKTYN